MSSFSTGSGDAVAARARSGLTGYVNWLTSNNVKGLIGEFGWPGSSNPGTDPINTSGGGIYDPAWDAVGQQVMLDYNAAGLYFTNWTASEWGINLRSYRTDDGSNKAYNYRTTVSSVLEANYAAGGTGIIRGVNLAGADFSDAGPNGALNLSTSVQPGAGYYYPTQAGWAVLYSRGVRLVRLCVRWERIQPTLKGALGSDFTLVQNSITAAGQAGIKVLLDLHNYGRYDTAASGNTSLSTNGVYDLGQNAPATHNGNTVGGTMISCFTDLWTKVATGLKGNAGLWGYGLVNEPHDLTGNVATWVSASQQATEAIRLVDTTGMISVAGYFYATCAGWVSQNGSTAWLTETIPAGQPNAGQARNTDPKLVFEAHHYWDNDGSGTFASTYAAELTDAQNQGYTSYTNSGYVAPSTGNTQQTGQRQLFASSMDASTDFTATNSNTNTLTIPYASLGNPGNSLRVTTTATSDEGAVRKSLTAAQGLNVRQLNFDFYVPSGATVSSSANFTVLHCWDNTYTNDLVEVRMIGSGSGYILQLQSQGSTVTTVSGTTINSLGAWHTIRLVVTDTSFQIFIGSATSPDVTLSASNSGTNIGGIALGKFYGTSYVGNLYFDNVVGSISATYYGPPSGGFLGTVVTPVVSHAVHGLLGFFK